MKALTFPFQKTIIVKLKHKVKLVSISVYLSSQKFNDSIDLLLISNEFLSHYVYMKDFDRLMFNKTKHKGKNTFVEIVSNVLVVKRF